LEATEDMDRAESGGAEADSPLRVRGLRAAESSEQLPSEVLEGRLVELGVKEETRECRPAVGVTLKKEEGDISAVLLACKEEVVRS